MTAREHAITASQLLADLERYQERIREEMADPDKRLQAIATGAVQQSNLVVEHTLDMANAHARVALAMAATEGEEP